MSGSPTAMRAQLWLFALAVLVRTVVAARTHVPARDAEAYLWMAREAAHGHLGAAFSTVFHPLYSLLVALPLGLFPGLDPVLAGQVVSIALGALAVFPLWRLTERLYGAPAATATGFLYAVGVWFARHPADCLSEGPFYLAVAGAAGLLLGAAREQGARTPTPLLAGALAGLAYALRPEGAALAIVGVPWLCGQRLGRAALLAALGFVATALWWPLGWWLYGDGFTLTPKAAFNWEVGVGTADGVGISLYFANLVGLCGDAFEAIGFVALPLALLGLGLERPRSWRAPAALLLAPFLLQLLVAANLRSNIRFLSGYGLLLLPFAGVGWQWFRQRVRGWHPGAKAALVFLVVAPDLARIPQERRADRIVLRELGLYLREKLRAGETVATDMPRLGYFAGLPPIPPRRITRAEVLDACGVPATRYVAVVAPRTGVLDADLAARGFAPVELPEGLRRLVDARSVLVYERR